MPFTYKTWRKEVWEVFIDNRFFYMNAATSKKWVKVIGTAFSIEKERMTELFARIMTTPSNTFFSNKDVEAMNRAANVRRLSFVLFAGITDQYVPQLPVIQERIVELLKLDHGEMVHMEIYLCLRVILMRFSQKHLMNFWPVLITELVSSMYSIVVSFYSFFFFFCIRCVCLIHLFKATFRIDLKKRRSHWLGVNFWTCCVPWNLTHFKCKFSP